MRGVPDILLWDYGGTTAASKNPTEHQSKKIVLPHVRETMEKVKYNFVISGYASTESDRQDYDSLPIIGRFTSLIADLPVQLASFSPLKEGRGCYVVMGEGQEKDVLKAHEDAHDKDWVGKFKKPHAGMLVVLNDLSLKLFGLPINHKTAMMVGDTWHDEAAAKAFGVPFVSAYRVHEGALFL